MEKLEPMVDMANEPDEAEKDASPIVDASNEPKYPYGLAISLTEKELEKLGVDYTDWTVGDHFHLHALAKITSISLNQMQDGSCCRVGLQIVALSGENEEEENEDEEENEPVGLYGHL